MFLGQELGTSPCSSRRQLLQHSSRDGPDGRGMLSALGMCMDVGCLGDVVGCLSIPGMQKDAGFPGGAGMLGALGTQWDA